MCSCEAGYQVSDFHKFDISFWYNTDRRYECQVVAIDQVQALVFALAGVKGSWPSYYPFRIEIKAVETE